MQPFRDDAHLNPSKILEQEYFIWDEYKDIIKIIDILQ